MMRTSCLTALILLIFFASPAAASEFGRFWAGFKTYWGDVFGSIGGRVGAVLLLGATGVFIITRGKWAK